MPEPTLYLLFDGYNVLRAAGLEERHRLIDSLASFVAVRGARGVVVFDGVGADEQYGPLEVRSRRTQTPSSSASPQSIGIESGCVSSPRMPRFAGPPARRWRRSAHVSSPRRSNRSSTARTAQAGCGAAWIRDHATAWSAFGAPKVPPRTGRFGSGAMVQLDQDHCAMPL